MRRVTLADHHDLVDTHRGAHLLDDRREERIGETHLRTRVGEDVLELLRREPQVQRVDDAGAEKGRVIALEELVPVERHHREPVAPVDSEATQPGRKARDPVEMLTERRAILALEEPRTIGVAFHRGKQQVVIDELFHVPVPLAPRPSARLDASRRRGQNDPPWPEPPSSKPDTARRARAATTS